MKHLFIINPAAGHKNRAEEYRERIHAACLSRGLRYGVALSKEPGDATRIAREAAQSGEEVRIYACGGDGTLNEVAAGAAGYPNAAVTVFAAGSGNDFIKTFDDPQAFFDLERLLDAEEATFDMIRCNDDLALNICCVGLDSRIGRDAALYKRMPLLGGSRAYLAAVAVNFFRGISEHYVVEIDGERIEDRLTFVCVCNGRFYGGGFNPIPEADPSDGMLDILLVNKVSRAQVPTLIGKYKDGRYKELSHVARYFRSDSIRILCDKPTAINLDGEQRTAQVVDMSIADEKIRFFYPKGLSWKNAECRMQNTK